MASDKQEKTGLRPSKVLMFMGTVLAFAIGAGFASGQELTQYFSAYGWKAPLVGLVFIVIFVYSNYLFAVAGKRGHLTKGSQVFRYYCGKYLGMAFDIFAALFCYMSFVVMVGGAANTLNQQYGLPLIVGGGIIAVLAIITVIFGLNGIVNVISKIGPILVGVALVIGITSLIMNAGNVAPNVARIESGEVQLVQASNNWFMAGASYGGFCLLWFAGFMATLGSQSDGKRGFKELMAGQTLSGTFNIIACVLLGFAIVASVDLAGSAQIPNLVLAEQIWPPIAYIFAIIIFVAVYSTSCPLLWTGVVRFSDEGTNRFRILTIVGAVAAVIIALYVPYSTLINVLYVINGYGGFLLFIIMVIQDIRYRVKHKGEDLLAEDEAALEAAKVDADEVPAEPEA